MALRKVWYAELCEFYDKSEFPRVKEDCTSSLRKNFIYKFKVIEVLGFKYKESNDEHKFLLEWGDIVAEQLKFLQTVHNIRVFGDIWSVFYLDKTWVNQNHTVKYIWQDSTKNGRHGVHAAKEMRHMSQRITTYRVHTCE
jgi:hypothetical protein